MKRSDVVPIPLGGSGGHGSPAIAVVSSCCVN